MKDLFITCPHGFEKLLQEELLSLGISKAFPSFCGVFIPKTMLHAFIANYQSRIATRVLWPLAEFSCRGREDLYNHSYTKIDWSSILHCNKTFAIDANVNHPTLTHSLFAARVVKDGICDYFRDKTGSRPSVDIKDPDVQLNLFIQKGKATIYLDTSGAPLHKRGWRTNATEASIHESLAAALLLYTHYLPDQHILCDPFCGSGTFLIEAAWIATHTPPGILRKKWGFFHLPPFNMHEWKEWKQKIDAKRSSLLPQRIFGSDKSRSTVDLCKEHLVKAGFSKHLIEVDFQEVAYYHPPKKPNFLITNPPYGKRLDTSEKLTQEIASFLSTELEPNSPIHILCPEAFIPSSFEKKVHSEFFFKNGGLPVKLVSM